VNLQSTLELDSQFLAAYQLLDNSPGHIFVTGQAGTGKSTLLQYFREHTSKSLAVLAPTGVAAVNVRGQTVHSFFRFRPDITVEAVEKIRLRREDREMFQGLDAIVIDEVSMLRADIMDCVDAFLRRFGRRPEDPFGGVQMIFVGDLYQLPPVVKRDEQELFREFYSSPYFFAAKVFRRIQLNFVDLEKIYRQKEDDFIALLNAIRHNRVTAEQLRALNARCASDFEPDPEDFYVYLTTTNALAESINKRRLAQLPGKSMRFRGEVDGSFEDKNLPTPEILEIKAGAQVMLLNNDQEGRWVNGTIGKVVSVQEDLTSSPVIVVELENGQTVEVPPFRWEMFRFFFNDVTRAIEAESTGAFVQYPLKLAWAVTIHKSQGKTFSKVIVDIGAGAFSHGQTYVALSRCTALSGLVLRRPISRRDILLDRRVVEFLERRENSMGEKAEK